MKKKGLWLIGIGFGLFVVYGQQTGLFGSSNPDSFPKLPQTPHFTVSTLHDGEWMGRRIDVTGNNLCERTTITGVVEDGLAKLTLTYNGTSLKGWINQESDELVLYATNRQWDYRFKGTVGKNKIQGNWYLTNGPCKGNWYLEKQS